MVKVIDRLNNILQQSLSDVLFTYLFFVSRTTLREKHQKQTNGGWRILGGLGVVIMVILCF
jgi:hypothetical protein